MKKLSVFLVFCCLTATFSAQAAEVDLTFSQQRGQVLVTDSFGKIGKSDVSVETIKEMQKTIDRLSAEVKALKDRNARTGGTSDSRAVERLSSEMRAFKDRLSSLERKVNSLKR